MRVAIAGCGQLARMMALAGLPLGIKFSFLADHGKGSDIDCVEGLGDIVYWHDQLLGDELYQALKCPDVFTFEKEQVNLDPIRSLEPYTTISPPIKALEACKYRHKEKALLDSLGLASAEHVYVNSPDDFAAAIQKFSFPAVVKSVSDGYDGKSQWRIKAPDDAQHVPHSAIEKGVIIEAWVPFIKEVSVVAVRDHQGNLSTYPITENEHENGILVRSTAPAEGINEQQQQTLNGYVKRIMDALDYVGVIGMECFVTDEDILINELAPRVHNSGHWTQNGAKTCQFENHIRAISRIPLGATEPLGVAGMINLIGTEAIPREQLTENSSLHWYNKHCKPGRKLGHVNYCLSDREALLKAMERFI